MTIMRAKREDAELLSQLAFRSKAYWGYSDDFMEACRMDLTVSSAFVESTPVYVMRIDDKIVGFYSLVCSKDNAELRDFFVDTEMIGKGIGKKLWKHMKETARSLHIKRVFIHSDPHAERFYEAMGARRVGEVVSSVFPDRRLPLMEYKLDGSERHTNKQDGQNYD